MDRGVLGLANAQFPWWLDATMADSLRLAPDAAEPGVGSLVARVALLTLGERMPARRSVSASE